MRRIQHSVRQVTLDIACATAAERVAIVRSITGLPVRVSAFERSASGMTVPHNLFVPTELEIHLIVSHDVPESRIATQRRFCKEQGKDYDEFVKTNHEFMHGTRATHVGHTHDG